MEELFQIEEKYSVSKFKASIQINKKEIAHGTLLINYRQDLNDRPIGFIEDIWTDENYRKQGLGSKIVKHLISQARAYDCYKVVLDCATHNVDFYEKLGFKKWQNSMRIDL